MWKNQVINLQNIKAKTEKAVLIQMPHKSKYDGFCFWHPTKLLRNGSHSYEKSISYTDEFVFKLKKYGQGKYNQNKVIKEIEISAQQFEEEMSA